MKTEATSSMIEVLTTIWQRVLQLPPSESTITFLISVATLP